MTDVAAPWHSRQTAALTEQVGPQFWRVRSRGEIFAALTVLGLFNGLVTPIYRSITESGWWSAVFDTFRVSAFVWIAALVTPMLMLRSSTSATTKLDRRFACACLVLIALPVPHLSWVALTALALYLAYGSAATSTVPSDPLLRRGAMVLLASTAAMFWGRLALENSGSAILAADAAAVSFFTGMAHVSNVVETADGGRLWIAPYCSSLSNISLAVLCSALVVQRRGLPWTGMQAARCLAAVVMVVVINDLRMAAMVLRPDLYETIHGAGGAAVANVLTVGVIACVILWGNERREHRAG